MTGETRKREAEAFKLHAELCKALTDPKRLMMLKALSDGGVRSVSELADAVGMRLPNASQHLSVMRHAGLVEARREGTVVYYSLVEPRIVEACDIVHRIVLDRLEAAPAPPRLARLPVEAWASSAEDVTQVLRPR